MNLRWPCMGGRGITFILLSVPCDKVGYDHCTMHFTNVTHCDVVLLCGRRGHEEMTTVNRSF